MENTPTVSTILESVGSIGETILGFATSVFNWGIANPVYMIFLGVSLFGIGFGVVRKVTHR